MEHKPNRLYCLMNSMTKTRITDNNTRTNSFACQVSRPTLCHHIIVIIFYLVQKLHAWELQRLK